MSPPRLLTVIAFWACLIGAYVFALMPGREAPSVFLWDKLNHMLAFFVVTILYRLAYPRTPVVVIAVAMALFGSAIELSQAVPFIHRDAEWDDWFADCGAAIAGLIVAWPLTMLVRKWRIRHGLISPSGSRL